MSFERYRKRLQEDRREWGDRVPCLPHTPSPTRNPAHDSRSPPLADSPDPLPDPPAGPLGESTYLRIPIPANTSMISTKGWSLNSLINRSINFHRVPRVSVLSDTLLQAIDDHETYGVPLVIEGCHKHPKWSTEGFTLDSFASASPNDISVRNVHNWQDTTIPLSDFITKSRSIATFAEEGEQERFYGKDAPCPGRWEEWLKKASVVPESLLCGGSQDFFRYRPKASQIETLMCYLGVGDTFTPCHKDLCASSGQNLMCHTENDGSSFWFMTESASALDVAKFFHSLGRELDHENYVITVEELMKAPFKVYILEQKLGDLVLVPPRSAHQVVNFGGITVKTSWSRMTLKGLVTAYHHELPIYRRVCRPETYRVKSTIRYVLLGLTFDLRLLAQKDGKREEHLVSNIQELLVVFDHILAEEESDTHSNFPSLDEANITESVVCDFCGADIFQGFFECRICVEVDSVDGGYIVCPGCYVEGRSCRHQIMQPMQRRPFKYLSDARKQAMQVVDTYERRYGRSFQLSNDINNAHLRTFRAALILLDIYKTKTKSMTKVCTVRRIGNSHPVPSSSALYCKLCHYTTCFSHVLLDRRMHSIEALLLHDSDNTHDKYHHSHIERKARFDTSPLELPLLVYYAINFTYCKPINPHFMKLGWYDANAHMSYMLDDQELPDEMETTLVPDATVPVSDETGPIVVQPPTNNVPEPTVKPTKKRKVYVLVPPAPYPLPHHSDQRNQANSPTPVPLVTRDELQPTVNKPEQRAPSSEVGGKVLKTLSDIGISIPTTVRISGSYIIHSLPHIMTQSTEHSMEPVNPRHKPPHAGNPVTAQVITKGSTKPISTFKFNRSNKVNPIPSSSNNATDTTVVASPYAQEVPESPKLPQSQPKPPMPLPEVSNDLTELAMQSIVTVVASPDNQGSPKSPKLPQSQPKPPIPLPEVSNNVTEFAAHSFDTVVASPDAQGGPKSPKLPQSQPKPPIPLPEVSNDVTELAAQSIANKVMDRVDFMLTSNTHPPQHSGPPPQYNGPPHHYVPQQHINPPVQFHYRPHPYPPATLQYVHYSTPQQHNDLRPQHNGPPPYFNHDPYVRPQRHNNQVPHHAPSYPVVKQPQFHQDIIRSPQKRGPVQSAVYVNRSQDLHNGRNNMSGNSARFEGRPNKKRRYNNGRQDSQSQVQHLKPRFDARPPQGPRGKYNSARRYSSPRRVECDRMKRSTSSDHQHSPRRTSSEGTSTSTLLTEPSEYFQSQGDHGNRSYYRQQNTSKMETNSQSHYPSTSVEPEIEQSTEDHTTNNDDDKDDVIDVDLYDTAPPETALPTANPTTPNPEIEQYDDGLYSNGSVMEIVIDDALHEVGMPVDDNLPAVPTVGDQGNDQDWESTYAIEDLATEVVAPPAPQSAPQQLVPADTNPIIESMFNADNMADVTSNPWTT